jgi:hypothetical protein
MKVFPVETFTNGEGKADVFSEEYGIHRFGNVPGEDPYPKKRVGIVKTVSDKITVTPVYDLDHIAGFRASVDFIDTFWKNPGVSVPEGLTFSFLNDDFRHFVFLLFMIIT